MESAKQSKQIRLSLPVIVRHQENDQRDYSTKTLFSADIVLK